MPTPPPQTQQSPFISPFDTDSSNAKATTATTNTTPAASNITSGSSRPLIRPILNEGHRLVDSTDFGSEEYEDEKNDVRLSASIIPRREGGRSRNADSSSNNDTSNTENNNSNNSRVVRQTSDNTTLRGGGTRGREVNPPASSANSTISPDSTLGPPIDINQPRPRLEQVGPHIATATIQAYNVLTVVRSVADPTWMVLKTSNDKSGGKDDGDHMGHIDKFETIFLALAVVCSLLSCIGFTLRIMDRMTWIRRAPVVTSYLQTAFCLAAIAHYHTTQKLPPGAQYAHGFVTCVLSIILSCLTTILLTLDWFRGFPSPGLTVALKELIISSFMMTIVIIIGAATYTWLEKWSFDVAVNFCIVSFSTIGYGNISPQTIAGRIIFFFYSVFGISAVGYFIVTLRNAVLEQFQWRLLERFSKPAHITRVQTRMSTKDMSFPLARFEEEQRVKKMVKRNMIIRMSTLWIVLWFGGAGVFCGFETWTYLDSLYFCFVTLTTVGFGDMVPTEPGSIEFWNIYVFLGLTVFAYILSLFSDTMASQIHLVDDGEEDEDEGMYGWEQCEDPNHQFSNWKSGAALGLEGVKWAQQQDSLKVNQGLGLGQELAADGGPNVLKPGQQTQSDRPRGVQRGVRFWNGSISGDSGGNIGPLDSQPASQHPLDRLDPLQPQQQQMSQMSQQRPRYKGQRRNSAGRILMIPAKERKQMLEAEYYATHGRPSIDTAAGTANSGPATTGVAGTVGMGGTGGGEMMVMTAPATIKFVDKYGIPHQRVIGRRMSYIPGGIQAHLQTGGSVVDTEPAGTSTGHSAGILANQQQQQQQQGYTFSTTGYSDALAKRRGTKAAVHQKRQEHHEQPPHQNADGHVYGHDGGQGRPATPMQGQYQHHNYDDTIQTGALEHQPIVRFESPRTRSGNGNGNSGNTASPQRNLQHTPPQQQPQQQSTWQWQQPSQSQGYYQNKSQDPLSTNPFDISSSSFGGNGMPLLLQPASVAHGTGGGLKMPWPTMSDITTDNHHSGYDYSHMGTDAYTATTSDNFARYLDLDHTRQSHSSDVTKVGSPPANVHLGPSPFFGDDNNVVQLQKIGGGGGASSRQSAARVSGVRIITGMQSPPTSRPATKSLPQGDRDNTIGPLNETRNSKDLPSFAVDTDLNHLGGTAPTTPARTATAIVQLPSTPQSPPSGAGTTTRSSPPTTLPLANNNTAMEQDVGPFGEKREPNKPLKFDDHVDLNHIGSARHPNPSPSSSFSLPYTASSSALAFNSHGGSGETIQQHQATLKNIMQSSSTSLSPPPFHPPAGPVTLSSGTSSYSSPNKNTNFNNASTTALIKDGSNDNNSNKDSINARATATATTSLPMLHDYSSASPVGPFGETRRLSTEASPRPNPSSGAGAGAGAGARQALILSPLTAQDVGLDQTGGQQHQKQHHKQDQTHTTATTPDPFQSSSLSSFHHPTYNSEGAHGRTIEDNPFFLFSRQTNATGPGVGKMGGGPLSPRSPPNRKKSVSPSHLPPPPRQLHKEQQCTSTNPFLVPQGSMASQQQQQLPAANAPDSSLPMTSFSPPPPSVLPKPSPPLSRQNTLRPQEESQVVQQKGQAEKGPFDETRSQNPIPWFNQDVDLNKIGPDPLQVHEARKSSAEIERRTSAKQAEILFQQQKRASASEAPSM